MTKIVCVECKENEHAEGVNLCMSCLTKAGYVAMTDKGKIVGYTHIGGKEIP